MSPILFHLRNCSQNEFIVKSLLVQIVSYKENGILPYSAYIFRNSNEQAMYCAALSISAALFLLQNPSDLEEQEVEFKGTNTYLFMTEVYLRNQGEFGLSSMEGLFSDEDLLLSVFEYIFRGICSCYLKNETLLPYSFKENALIEELVYLLLSLLNKHEVSMEVLADLKKPQLVVLSLLILLDNLVNDLQNGLFHTILSLLLKLSTLDSFVVLLNSPNTLKYKFKSLPVLSGTVNDYFFGLLIIILNQNLKKNIPDDDVFEFIISILNNAAIYSFDLQNTTCLMFFDLLRKLEDYQLIVRNPKLLQIALDLFFVVEKLLVFNWSKNSLLGAHLWVNRAIYHRFRLFGNNRNKLGCYIKLLVILCKRLNYYKINELK